MAKRNQNCVTEFDEASDAISQFKMQPRVKALAEIREKEQNGVDDRRHCHADEY